MSVPHRLNAWIAAGIVAGIAVGWLIHDQVEAPAAATRFASVFATLTELFLRLIKMVIAPLVLSTLMSGIAHSSSKTALGRTGLRAMLVFLCGSLVSMGLGVAGVALLRPGAAVHTSETDSTIGPAGISVAAFDARAFIVHLVPQSLFEALSNNEILQIVCFSAIAGVALSSLGSRALPLLDVLDSLGALTLKMTQNLMRVAPIAVFAALAAALLRSGPAILIKLGWAVVTFYICLSALWLAILLAARAVLGRQATLDMLRNIREPLLVAFATASSEAAYAGTLDGLQRSGVPKHIASFMLPLGYSFNLVGSMLYCAFAVPFVAQAFGIPLTIAQQIGMLLIMMVMSKGVAGVPRGSLVVIAAALPQFNLPERGLIILLGIDQFLDMGRTATNVLGNSIAAALVARWEVPPAPPPAH